MSKELKLKIFSTLAKKIEEFVPIDHGKVSFYACGPTVYDYTHLGHLRRYTMDDVLIRLLKLAGHQVKFVQNVTDVGHLASDADTGEDKLEKGAKKYHQSVWEIAKKFETYFFQSNDQMGNLRPDISCRATDHIREQIEMIKTLEKKGFTYVIAGDGVYFDTSKLNDYGKLASQKLDQLLAGARVEMVAGKKQPTDFALWKFEKKGENRAMSWPSPWSKRGFPGWHIECSAMSCKYLGDQIDIHTGGIDHIPVHHTNEIAQTESATGKKPFVKFWLHHNFMSVDGQKMSKSLNNFFTVDDVIKKGFSPRALRLLFMTAHYRSELNFTWQNLAGMEVAYEKLLTQVKAWQSNVTLSLSKDKLVEVSKQKDNVGTLRPTLSGASQAQGDIRQLLSLSAEAQNFSQQFWQYLADDLNTPQALTVVWQMAKSNLSQGEKLWLIRDFDQVLQLGLENLAQTLRRGQDRTMEFAQLPEEIQKLLTARAAAKHIKNYQLADELRQQLAGAGYKVIDKNGGQIVKHVDS